MRRRRRTAVLILAVLMVLACTGCMSAGVEGLYSLPKISDEYTQLEQLIGERIAAGAEYAAPVGGSHRQSIQMHDLDGDGVEEAIAFLASQDHAPTVCIYRQDENRDYYLYVIINGEGSSISSVEYADLTGNGTAELILSWQISGDIHLLCVYDLQGDEPSELLSVDCSYFSVFDLDGDGTDELYDLQLDYNGVSVLVRYAMDSDGQIASSTARLSSGITEVQRMRTGYLSDGATAIFVESTWGESSLITDVFTVTGGTLDNITISSDGQSNTVRMEDAYATDINDDRTTEIPEASGDILNWYALDSSGRKSLIMTTYHDYADSWYLILPDSLVPSLSVTTDQTVAGEARTMFSVTGDDGTSQDVLILYALTGENRADRAQADGRTVLAENDSTIYAAEVLTEDFSIDDITDDFNLIYAEWQTGDL